MKLIESKRLLYDGLETDELYNRHITIGGVGFIVSEVIDNRIVKLKDGISHEDFLKLTQECGFQTNSNADFTKHFKGFDFEEFYLSKEGLALYYAIKPGLLCIFSFGESQPARYKLYIEGAWEL